MSTYSSSITRHNLSYHVRAFVEEADLENHMSSLVEEKPAEDGDGPPDGGLTAWLVVLGAWCVLFCSFGWINSMNWPGLVRLIVRYPS